MSDRLKRWTADTAERVIATFAQAALGLLPAAYLPHTHLPVGTVLAGAGFAALVSLLKCVAALKVGAPDSASLLPEDVDPPQGDE